MAICNECGVATATLLDTRFIPGADVQLFLCEEDWRRLELGETATNLSFQSVRIPRP
ncbi:hypothetical protein SEA_WOCKET_34 [Gordonia phage Wocket]|nr:hypothetical protein SEA_WOCKET_34 [Gordonia phage Wocket]